LQKDSVFGRILGFFIRKKPEAFRTFRDGMGNFEISIPEGWRFDTDIAVVDGRYTISFQSPGGKSGFTISVDAQLAEPFDFESYAKAELESPESGIYTPVIRGEFRGMPAFRREYRYDCGGGKYEGGGLMFHGGRLVFSLSWSSPEKEAMRPVFDRMVESLSIGGCSVTITRPRKAAKKGEEIRKGGKKKRGRG